MSEVEVQVISNDRESSVIRRILKVITIEPAVFLFTFGYGLQMIISQVSLNELFCLLNKLIQNNKK